MDVCTKIYLIVELLRNFSLNQSGQTSGFILYSPHRPGHREM